MVFIKVIHNALTNRALCAILYYMKETNYTFKDFVQAVDEVCYTRLGCSVHDLPDYPIREDWEECEENLAYIAPEDVEHRKNVFRDHVSYTCNDFECENLNDYQPEWM